MHNQHNGRGTYLWIAGAVGAVAGIAALAISRRREHLGRRPAGAPAKSPANAAMQSNPGVPWPPQRPSPPFPWRASGNAAARRPIAKTGARLLRRVQQLSGETSKLYPSVKKLMA